jgi:hypothetical protein
VHIILRSTITDYLAKARQLVNRVKKSNYLDHTLKACIVIILISCLIATSAISLFSTEPVEAAEEYIFDKVIQWADGTTEHVQIGEDGYFVLDGTKKPLVGMFLYTFEMPYDRYKFWIPENLEVYDKALGYLESIGVRFVHLDMRYVLWWMPSIESGGTDLQQAYTEEKAAQEALLELIYKHKMLLAPGVFGKWNDGEGQYDISQRLDFPLIVNGQTDMFSQWATRWVDTFSQYPNVVSVVAAQELDGTNGLTYTADDASNYLDFLMDIIRPRVNVPIVHNLIGDMDMDEWRIDIKRVCLQKIDNSAFCSHQPSLEYLDAKLTDLTRWLESENYSTTGWWNIELSRAYPPDNSHFTPEYIDTVFDHGASIVTLFMMCNEHSTNNDWAFFDASGNPKQQMVQIAEEIPRLQAAISTTPEPSTELAVSTYEAGNITATSAQLNGNLDNGEISENIYVSFEWGTSSGDYINETSIQMMDNTGIFYFTLAELDPATTYYFRAKAVGDDTVYGEESSFTTLALASAQPVVSTTGAGEISATTATLNGELTDMGTAETVDVSFEWGTSAGEYTNETTILTVTEPGNFNMDITELTSETTFYYRAKATGDGIAYGEEQNFTSGVQTPTIPTSPSLLPVKTSVILRWQPVDGATYYILQVSINPDCSREYLFNEEVGKQSKQKVKGFTVGTTYYWRLKAGNINGVSDWSPVWSFTIEQ